MTALYNSPFLIALGWTIFSSLWQAALLWLIYQLVAHTDKRNTPVFRHNLAVLATGISFFWFAITLVQNYSAIIQLTRSATGLSTISSEAAKALLAIQNSTSHHHFFELLSSYLPYFSTAYLIVLFFLVVKLVNAYLFSRKMRTIGLQEATPYWIKYINQYASHIGIKRKVKIFFSEYINVPATLAYFKPVILIPIAAFNQLTPSQMESILLHELAHIRRNDYFINIVVSVIETVLFFNPFVHLLGKSIRKEREHCCDDLALQYNCDAHGYASALLSLEKMRIGIQPIAVAATGNDNQLLSRVKRIMNVRTTNFNYGQEIFVFVCIAFFLISIAWLTPDQHINSHTKYDGQFSVKTESKKNINSITIIGKKIINHEKTLTISPDQKTINITKKIIVNPVTSEITAIEPLKPLPPSFVPDEIIPPAPSVPPAPFDDFEPLTRTYHFETPEFAEMEFSDHNNTGLEWQKATQHQFEKRIKLLNSQLRLVDSLSATSLTKWLKQAKEQQLLNGRQLELMILDELPALAPGSLQKHSGEHILNRKTIPINTDRADNLYQQQQPLKKKPNKPSVWI